MDGEVFVLDGLDMDEVLFIGENDFVFKIFGDVVFLGLVVVVGVGLVCVMVVGLVLYVVWLSVEVCCYFVIYLELCGVLEKVVCWLMIVLVLIIVVIVYG